MVILALISGNVKKINAGFAACFEKQFGILFLHGICGE